MQYRNFSILQSNLINEQTRCKVTSLEHFFSHMRLRKPTGSLVLDRSIRDGDLARSIHALPSKSKQSNAALIVGIVPLRR